MRRRFPACRGTDGRPRRGLIGDRKIEIVYTGIRPGEKIHEIMVSEEEPPAGPGRVLTHPADPARLRPDDDPGPFERRIQLGDDVMDHEASRRSWQRLHVEDSRGRDSERCDEDRHGAGHAAGDHSPQPRHRRLDGRANTSWSTPARTTTRPQRRLLRDSGSDSPTAISASAATLREQVGQILAAWSSILREERPDRLLILGDTNSGLAALSPSGWGSPSTTWRPAIAASTIACPRRSTAA